MDPRLLVIRGLVHRPAPTFPIGSPGKEDDYLHSGTALASHNLSSHSVLPGLVYTSCDSEC